MAVRWIDENSVLKNGKTIYKAGDEVPRKILTDKLFKKLKDGKKIAEGYSDKELEQKLKEDLKKAAAAEKAAAEEAAKKAAEEAK